MDVTANYGSARPTGDRMAAVGRFVTGTARGRIVKGVLAVAFGVVLLVWPAPTVLAMVWAFGTFAIVDGAYALVAAASAPRGERSWPVVHGIVGVIAGVVVYAWPGITALALLYVIGTWAIVKGLAEIGAAIRLPLSGGGRLFVGLSGLLGVAFGVIMLARPGAGAVALITLVAALAIATGLTFIVAGYELARAEDEVHDLLTR